MGGFTGSEHHWSSLLHCTVMALVKATSNTLFSSFHLERGCDVRMHSSHLVTMRRHMLRVAE